MITRKIKHLRKICKMF